MMLLLMVDVLIGPTAKRVMGSCFALRTLDLSIKTSLQRQYHNLRRCAYHIPRARIISQLYLSERKIQSLENCKLFKVPPDRGYYIDISTFIISCVNETNEAAGFNWSQLKLVWDAEDVHEEGFDEFSSTETQSKKQAQQGGSDAVTFVNEVSAKISEPANVIRIITSNKKAKKKRKQESSATSNDRARVNRANFSASKTRLETHKKRRRLFRKIEAEYVLWSQASKAERQPKKFHEVDFVSHYLKSFGRQIKWEKNWIREMGEQYFQYKGNHQHYPKVLNFKKLTTVGFYEPIEIPKVLQSQHFQIPMLDCDYFELNEDVDHVHAHFLLFDKPPWFINNQLYHSTLFFVEQMLSVFDGKCCKSLSFQDAHIEDFSARELASSPGLPFIRYAASKLDSLDWIDDVLLETYRIVQKYGSFALPHACFGEESLIKESCVRPNRLRQLKSQQGNISEPLQSGKAEKWSEQVITKGSWSYSVLTTIFERMFTIPIYNEITDPENWGKSPFKLPYENYYKKIEIPGQYVLCEFEILNLHQNIPGFFMKQIFKIIHRWIHKSDIVDFYGERSCDLKLFEALKQFFIHTPFILPNGQFILINHGAAYGSEFSLLVISVMSLFIGVYCMLNQAVDLDLKMNRIAVLGNFVSMCVPHTFSVLQMIRDVEAYGFEVDATNIHFGKDHSFAKGSDNTASDD